MTWWRAALVATAAGLALAPLSAPAVERLYSTGAFPPLQRALTGLSNLAPLAVFDVLLAGLAVWWIASLGRDTWMLVHTVKPDLSVASLAGWFILRRAIVRTVTAAAAVYLAFLMTWGLNYRRVPLMAKLRFDESAITPVAVRELALRAVKEVNALYVEAHSQLTLNPPVDAPSFTDAFVVAQRAVGVTIEARPARPKRSVIDPYFRAAGVEGMTDPFFLETLVAGGLLPFELPFVVAHEWSHLAGFADEGEANFVGWLTCVRGSDAARYSGWLFLYRELAAALPASERTAVAQSLRPGPRSDLRAIADRIRRDTRPAVSNAGWRVYDSYLKANRVEAGTASYAQVVRLVLGTRAEQASLLRAP